MKKFLMSVAFLVIYIGSSKSESLPEMSCMGGMTSCGKTYMFCYEGAVNAPSALQLAVNDYFEAEYCALEVAF